MRKSSIHIEKTRPFEFFHNSREYPTKNSIFSKENNFCSIAGSEAYKLYKQDIKEKEKKYKQLTGQKLQKSTIKLFSAVVNLDERHTSRDVEKIAEYLEHKLGCKVYQISIHRDEGHFNENGNPVINHHAHIIFSGLDENGRSVRRKLTKSFLRQLQTDVAKMLHMERGRENSKARHLYHKDFKYFKEELKKELKLQKTLTKAELIEEKIKYIKELKEKINEYESKEPKIKDDLPFNLKAWLLAQSLNIEYKENEDIQKIDLQGYFINKDDKNGYVLLGNKQKNIFITIKGNEIIGNKTGSDKEQARLMFQIVKANGKDPLTIKIQGSYEFIREFERLQREYLQEQIGELRKENERLGQDKEELREENLRYYKEKERLKEENKQLKKENKNLKDEIEKLKNDIKGLRQSMIEVNKQSYKKTGAKIYTQQDYLYLSELKKILNAKNYEEILEKVLKLKEQLKEYKKINKGTKKKEKENKKEKDIDIDINF